MKIDGMGVLVLVAHLIITLAVLVLYAISSLQGHQDETLKALLFAIIGYWFGAVGVNAIKKKDDTKNE